VQIEPLLATAFSSPLGNDFAAKKSMSLILSPRAISIVIGANSVAEGCQEMRWQQRKQFAVAPEPAKFLMLEREFAFSGIFQGPLVI
jgi:hypothetical protein